MLDQWFLQRDPDGSARTHYNFMTSVKINPFNVLLSHVLKYGFVETE